MPDPQQGSAETPERRPATWRSLLRPLTVVLLGLVLVLASTSFYFWRQASSPPGVVRVPSVSWIAVNNSNHNQTLPMPKPGIGPNGSCWWFAGTYLPGSVVRCDLFIYTWLSPTNGDWVYVGNISIPPPFSFPSDRPGWGEGATTWGHQNTTVEITMVIDLPMAPGTYPFVGTLYVS